MSMVAMVVASVSLAVAQQKAPVFLYAGQSNADGREYTTNLPDYMKDNGSLPSSPYTHLLRRRSHRHRACYRYRLLHVGKGCCLQS